MKKLYRAADKALKAIADELERRAIDAALKLSRSHPDQEIMFCSAMGSWFWHGVNNQGNESEYAPPVNLSFCNAQQAYGWDAIPAPIRVKCRNGRIIEQITNW